MKINMKAFAASQVITVMLVNIWGLYKPNIIEGAVVLLLAGILWRMEDLNK